MLQAIWNVGEQEPAIGVGQPVIDRVAAGDCAVVLQSVDVIVGRTNTQFSFKNTSSHELQGRRDNQLLWLCCDEKTTFVSPQRDLNNRIFQ